MFARHPRHPYLLTVRVPYNAADVLFLRSLQGAEWDSALRCWAVPEEYADALTERLGQLCQPGRALPTASQPPGASEPATLQAKPLWLAGWDADLWPYQCEDLRFLARHTRKFGDGWILAYKMRMRKTATALRYAYMRDYRRILVVCPAMARGVWEREFALRWPKGLLDVPTMTAASLCSLYRPKVKAAEAWEEQFLVGWDSESEDQDYPHILVTSYSNLHQLPGLIRKPDLIVFDELHQLGNLRTRQGKAAVALVEGNPLAYRLGLTGTLQRNDTPSLYGPLSIIFPHRWGLYYNPESPERSFTVAYGNPVFNGYGHDFHGLVTNPAEEGYAPEAVIKQAELRRRLQFCSTQRTRNDPDTKHLFPSCEYLVEKLEAHRSFEEIAPSGLAGGESVALMFWLRDSAEKAFEAIKFENKALLTGAETPERRHARLTALKPGPALLVATIASTQVAIDLSRFTDAHYIELPEQTAMLEQSAERFALGGGRVTLWATPENYETMRRQARKLAAISAVMNTGKTATEMQAGFQQQTQFTKEEWESAIANALSLVTEGL